MEDEVMPVNSFDDYPMSWKPQRTELEQPYYLSIAARLESDILSGNLPENTKLPPQRELADFLDLNVSTITRAYKLCELKGLLYAVTGKGTFVSSGLSAQDTFFSRNGGMIELGMIQPFYETNGKVLQAAQRVISSQDSLRLFEYSDPLGTAGQLSSAKKWLRLLGVHVKSDHILLSAGAQNALSVILISLFQSGDKIAVDRFTYTNFRTLANFLHIQLIAVDGDDCGMLPSALSAVCKHTQINGIYLMPTCSNPTGIFMPQNRREELAEIIRHYDLLLIEDDIYSFLSAFGNPAGRTIPFFHLLPENTIHICSVSKSLCAGLRAAFVAFPHRYRDLLTAGMLNINLKTVSLGGEIAAEMIESGEAERTAREKIMLARSRNRIFDTIFPAPKARQIEPFFRWLPIPDGLTSEELEILALKKGIHVLGSHRFALQSGTDTSSFVRLSVTSPHTEDDLRTGLMILKKVLEEKRTDFIV